MSKYTKIGKTQIRKDVADVMTWGEFKKVYAGTFGTSLEYVWKQLGGKLPKAKAKKEEE